MYERDSEETSLAGVDCVREKVIGDEVMWGLVGYYQNMGFLSEMNH